ncbi:general stress protein GlsB [Enterococcus faecium]|nr:general stress protein GlsB [Enterococcus faecium]
MGFIWALIVGGIIGAIAGAITNKGSSMGIIANITLSLIHI